MFTPIREGNRGGRGLFSWEDVRVMSYKDRECYLGSTVNLGFLDKGGRWRKKDWWVKAPQELEADEAEKQKIRDEDMQNLRESLGLANPGKKKKAQLSEAEYKTLLSKRGADEGLDLEDQGHKITGLGFDPANRVFGGKGGESKREKEAIKIEAEGIKHKSSHHKMHKKSKKHKHKKHHYD